MRGDRPRVIVEEFIAFDSEITLLTVATKDGVLFCAPIGHRQEAGDYRESWQPAAIPRAALHSAQHQARKVVEALGGHGIFGVEFFIRGDEAIFSELSPRPHDTGMVTLISQSPNEFELHLRAILGLPIPAIELAGPSASAVILADRESDDFAFDGVAEALALGAPGSPVDVRLFAKPNTLKNRRMGVALARGEIDRRCGRRPPSPRRQRFESAMTLIEAFARVRRWAGKWRIYERPIADRLARSLLAAAACDQSQPTQPKQPIVVRSEAQDQLHQLDDLNRAIALKRAIYDAGSTCKRVETLRLVEEYQNLVDVDGALRRRPRLGDLRRPRRQRAGARLQGSGGVRAAGLRHHARRQCAAQPALDVSRSGGFPYTRRPRSFP